MNPLVLAISSGIILSFDQVLIKLFLNKYEIQDISKLLNFKPLVFILVIGTIGIFGSLLWFLALQKSELAKLYWVTSLYYITIPLFSMIFLKENLSYNQIFGYLIISLGAVFASSK